jgi:hypothetical protein
MMGCEVFIMPKDCSDATAPPTEATTDLHYTVLPFLSGTGDVPVLCAIIFKSEQSIKDIPINWKLGIYLTV